MTYFLLVENMTEQQRDDVDADLNGPRVRQRGRNALVARLGGDVRTAKKRV